MARAKRKAGGADAEKLDLYKLHKDQYVKPKTPVLVTVPAVPYLAIDGQGPPAGETFQARIGGLYGTAFTLKFQSKFAGRDYKVCHLEGLYWGGEGAVGFVDLPREQWCWTLLIRVPDFIGAEDVEQAKAALREKGKPPDFEAVRLETLEEGPCVQVLHVGPCADEPASLEQMRQLAEDEGLVFHARHHEIYLSDPRRVAPERMRTILRVPVRPRGEA